MNQPLPSTIWYTDMIRGKYFDGLRDDTLSKGLGVNTAWLYHHKRSLAQAVRQIEKTDRDARLDPSKLARTILDRNAIFECLDWRKTGASEAWASQALGLLAIRCAKEFPPDKPSMNFLQVVFEFTPIKPNDDDSATAMPLVVHDFSNYQYRAFGAERANFHHVLYDSPATWPTKLKLCGPDITITCYVSGKPRYRATADTIWSEDIHMFSRGRLLEDMEKARAWSVGERIFVNPHPDQDTHVPYSENLSNMLFYIWNRGGRIPVDVTVRTGPPRKEQGHLAREREVYGKVYWDEFDPFRPYYDKDHPRPNVPVSLPGRVHREEEWESTDEEVDED